MALKYIENATKPLIRSGEDIDKRMFSILAYDILFMLAASGIILAALTFINWNLESNQDIFSRTNIVMGQLQTNTQADTAALAGEAVDIEKTFRNMFIFAGSSIAAAYLIIVFFISLFKGLIWSQILGQKFDRMFFKRFLQLNYVIWGIGLVLAILFLMVANLGSLTFYLPLGALLFFYFVLNIYSLFDKKERIWKTLGKGISVSIKKAYLFIVPYLLIAAAVTLLYWIASTIIRYATAIPYLGAGIIALFSLILVVWVRFYIFENVKSASQQ